MAFFSVDFWVCIDRSRPYEVPHIFIYDMMSTIFTIDFYVESPYVRDPAYILPWLSRTDVSRDMELYLY